MNEFNNKYGKALDLSRINTWFTYDEPSCINLKFSIDKLSGNLHCDATINNKRWDFSGYQELDPTFEALILLPSYFVTKLKDSIDYKLQRMAGDAYEDYLETQANLWKLNYINTLKSTI